MKATTLTCQCTCGKELEFEPHEGGELKRCPACRAPIMVPPSSSSPASPATPTTAKRSVRRFALDRRTEAPRSENVPASFGSRAAPAYVPSGEVGDLGTLVVRGLMGVALGCLGAGACVFFAMFLKFLTALSSRFHILGSLLIVFFTAIAPGVFVVLVGAVVGNGVHDARCRSPAMARLMTLFLSGLCLLGVFLSGRLIPIVKFMTRKKEGFEWVVMPDPATAPGHFLDLSGHALKASSDRLDELAAAITHSKKTDGMRFFSRRLTREQAERVRQFQL